MTEFPLGKYRVEIGLKLRQAMFLNGVLFNSEAWHAVTNDDLKPLEKVDESLLRALLQNHPKAPLEFLYLKTGSIKISNIISSRTSKLSLAGMMKSSQNEYSGSSSAILPQVTLQN